MKVKVFSIYDVKAQAYGQPFFMNHDGMATREFSDVVNDGKSTISKHAEDYSLYCIGEFDNVSGEVIGCKPRFISKGSDYLVAV